MSQSTRTVTLELPEELYRDFEEDARRSNRTAAELMRQALAASERQGRRRGGACGTSSPWTSGKCCDR